MKAKKIFFVLLCIAFSLFFIFALYILLPYKGLKEYTQRQNSTRFYDREGTLLHILPLQDGLRREYYPLEQIPLFLQQEFIQEEDKRFYKHKGVDVRAILRALTINSKEKRIVSGASTITMQLVRLINPRKKNPTVLSKLVEMFKAVKLERKLSKNQILELYLNSVPFGFQVEGVASAARSFYGCELSALSDEQMHYLSLIPRRPKDYAPRKNYEYKKLCPHFINFVIDTFTQNRKTIPNEVQLSIDLDLTQFAAKSISQKLQEYEEARIHNGAVLLIHNNTGEILCYVGNPRFEDMEHSGQIDGVLVKNQMGSSMKPFLYALALESGFSPNDVLPDIQQDFGTDGVYVPLNFNNRYNGPVMFRIALASSLNVPAVYILSKVGLDTYIKKLYTLGFDSLRLKQDSLGLSLALGAGEVSLLEMVRAFSVFANDGMLLDRLECVKTSELKSKQRVYERDSARIICDILSDKNARHLGFGNARVFQTLYPSIFKTGTSNQYQNIVAMASTSEFTVGVWMGNFEGETVVHETGSSIPATVARSLLDMLSSRYGANDFLEAENFVKQNVCALSGMLPNEYCPAVSREFVLKNKKDSEVCSWHSHNGSHVVVNYPSLYQHWLYSQNTNVMYEKSGMLQIQYPQDGAVFVYDPSLPSSVQYISVLASGGKENNATLFYDNVSFGKASDVLKWQIPLVRGSHKIEVISGNEVQVVHYTVK